MPTLQDFWTENHKRYSDTDWINKPSLFAQKIRHHLPKRGSLLDLGGGQGQDTRFFATEGFMVTMVDSSASAIKLAKEKTPDTLHSLITYKRADISERLPYPDSAFDVVYAHLSLHYFDDEATVNIFKEVYRVLKPGGTLALLVNAITDPQRKTGRKISPGLYLINGVTKRFFSAATLKPFVNSYIPVVFDSQGETYKDKAIGTTNLIRFVGQKKVIIF